jgi:hypothetical protein
MSNATMISMTSIEDLLTVKTKNFANKGMDYEEFASNCWRRSVFAYVILITTLVSSIYSGFILSVNIS